MQIYTKRQYKDAGSQRSAYAITSKGSGGQAYLLERLMLSRLTLELRSDGFGERANGQCGDFGCRHPE